MIRKGEFSFRCVGEVERKWRIASNSVMKNDSNLEILCRCCFLQTTEMLFFSLSCNFDILFVLINHYRMFNRKSQRIQPEESASDLFLEREIYGFQPTTHDLRLSLT